MRYPSRGSRLVAGGSTITLGESIHDNKTVKLDTAAGTIVTLPRSTGLGAVYRFIVSVLATSNSHIVKVGNTTDSMVGFVTSMSDNSNAALMWFAASGDDTITLNRSTTGSVSLGEMIEIVDVAAGVFAVRGFTSSTGTEATPFSATV